MENLCPKCQTIVDEYFNYCPMCGEPLTTLAVQREDLKLSNAGYEKLIDLVDCCENPAVAKAVKNYLANHQ